MAFILYVPESLMLDPSREPCRVHLVVGGVAHPAVALELTGCRAAVRSHLSVAPDVEAFLSIDWASGATTRLPVQVRTVAPVGGDQTIAHVDVHAVEGDWRPFLEYLGPLALAS